MRAFILAVLAMVVFTLQISFLPALRPLGVVPNAALVLVALVGLYGTASRALILAIIGGLMLDLVSGADFGLYVGLFILVALAAGYLHRAGLTSAGLIVAMGLVVCATLVQDLVLLGGLLRVASSWPVGHLVVTVLLETLLNVAMVLLLGPIIKRLWPRESFDLEVVS